LRLNSTRRPKSRKDPAAHVSLSSDAIVKQLGAEAPRTKTSSGATRRQSPVQARIPYDCALTQSGNDRKLSAPASQQGGVRSENSRNPLTWPLQKRPSSLGEAHIGPCEISVNALSQRKFFRCGTFPAYALFYMHFHAVTWAQSDALHGHNLMALDQLKTKSA